MSPYRGEISHGCPRQSGVATLIKQNSHVNDLDEFLDPYGDLFKDMSELDLFTILVTIKPPAF